MTTWTGGSGNPTSIGPGTSLIGANSATGDLVAIGAFGGTPVASVTIPTGQANDIPLFGTATWNGATLASLGLTIGDRTWTWGTGADQQFSIDVVPLPATLPLFASGLGGLGLLGWRRKRKSRAAVV